MAHEGGSFSSFSHGWTYDVFLSAKGENTRYSFTGSLYNALDQKGIKTFIDRPMLWEDENASPALHEAIEESRIAIIIFSENYASSKWCLDELVKIIDCMKEKGQLVYPVFYNVDPSDVRHQRGSYGRAMAEHEENLKNSKETVHQWRLTVERVHNWRVALTEASNISGWQSKNWYEFEIIQRITEEISTKLNHKSLHIVDYPVGLRQRTLEVMSLLNLKSNKEVFMVGIHGCGGIGKTTIARAVYNSIANQFEGSCFLAVVRENSTKHGLVQLQEILLSNLLGEKNINLGNVFKGISHRKKVLLVLDDVDNLDQLSLLAGKQDWFGYGSRIIITTRDKHLLITHGVEKLYEVKELNDHEALELFSWNAFKRRETDAGYMKVSKLVVQYAKGLPLALNVIGSDLFGKTIEEWKCAMKKYERIPTKEILDVLKVSYDNLNDNEKEIFLDIACFFKGNLLEDVEKTLDVSGGIGVLVDKALVDIDEINRVKMHDLIQELGWKIARKDSPFVPSKHRGLWYNMNVLEVLTKNPNLEFGYLGILDFNDNQILKEIPDISGAQNLEKLYVKNCKNLTKIHDFFGHLGKLRELVAEGCSKLHTFMEGGIKLASLEILNLSGCSNLKIFPEVLVTMKKIKILALSCTGIKALPESIEKLAGLECFYLHGCRMLREVPIHKIMKLRKLVRLEAGYCGVFKSFEGQLERVSSVNLEPSHATRLHINKNNISDKLLVTTLSWFPYLKVLELRDNNFKVLPACVKECHNLKRLYLDECKQLQKFKGIPPNLKVFSAKNCMSLTSRSTRPLLTQALHETGNTKFILPGKKIPKWFHKRGTKGSVSFWVGKKFPEIAVCVVFEIEGLGSCNLSFEFGMLINGAQKSVGKPGFLEIETDHVYLFDLRRQNFELKRELLEEKLNHVEVQCAFDSGKILDAKRFVMHIGVYAYNYESCMEDILFENPNPPKRTVEEKIIWDTVPMAWNYSDREDEQYYVC